jgi:hypothetical protein
MSSIYNYIIETGVIFALKVLTTHFDESRVSYLMGWIPIGSKYAVWGELVVIQLISPNASFVGHLAGILVGLAYIYGPLSYAIEFVFSLCSFDFQSFIANSIHSTIDSLFTSIHRHIESIVRWFGRKFEQ